MLLCTWPHNHEEIVIPQEMKGAVKVVKVEADPCPNLVEKYKVQHKYLNFPSLHVVKSNCVTTHTHQC